jgi:Tol biopolymer transport system component
MKENYKIWIAIILFTLIGLMIMSGDSVVPQVKEFNLNGEQVSVLEGQMIFEFNREMNKASVEKNINISPSLSFQVSWVGKKLYLTLEEPLVYGTDYMLSLTGEDESAKEMEIFKANFSTRSKELFMIDTSSETRQIMSYNPETEEQKMITPKNLYVTAYDFAHEQNSIVFFAVEEQDLNSGADPAQNTSLFPELYSLDLFTKEIQQLTNDPNFLNFDFFIAPDGKTLALNRVELEEKSGPPIGFVKMWIGELESNFQKSLEPFWYNDLKAEKIQFTGDSSWILGINNEGYILLPTTQTGGSPIFLGSFFDSFGFSNDGSKLLFTRWKDDNIFATTNELVLMYIDGSTEVLLENLGELASPVFDADSNEIYFTFTAVGGFESSLAKFSIETEEFTILDEAQGDRRFHLGVTADEKYIAYEKTLFSSATSFLELKDLVSDEIVYSVSARAPKWRD